jgi:two-component system, OmpR family, phosphate regulon response regulator OmpR
MMAQAPRIPLLDDAPHVLVVDDDRRLRDLLSRFLSERGYRVTTAGNAREAEERIAHLVFDALVLDVMMPGENGFDFARRLRLTNAVPILMLTARAEQSDRITGLEIGADDYLSKPFDPRELILRLANILKRRVNDIEANTMAARPEAVRFGPFSFRFERGELWQGDELIRLTDREREILSMLASRLGEAVQREELAEHGTAVNDRTVDVQINRLRRKFEPNPAEPTFLQTVRGVGYRLVIDRS